MMRRVMAAAAFAALSAIALPAWAQDSQASTSASATEGGQFVADLASRAVSELTTGEMPMQERVTRFRGMLTEAFDVPGIGRFVLGRYWRVASDSEKAEYLKLFEAYIVQTYVHRFN